MITLSAVFLIFIGTLGFSIFYIISLQPAALSSRIGDKAYKICGFLRMIAMVFEMAAIAGYILFVFGDKLNYAILKDNEMIIRIAGAAVTGLTVGFTLYSAKVAGWEAAVPNKESNLYGGIYNYMRHPQTLGEMLSWFGIAMILNSLTLLVYSIIWIPLFYSYTVLEDNDLALRFGDEYTEYSKRVGAFRRKKSR